MPSRPKSNKVEGDIKKVHDTVTWPGGESSGSPGAGDKPAPAAATGPAGTEGKNP